MLLLAATYCGAATIRRARNTEMGVHCRAGLHFGVQMGMTVEWAEIAETRSEQLELVE